MLWFVLWPAGPGTAPVFISAPFLPARCLISEPHVPRPKALIAALGFWEEGAGLSSCVSENRPENNDRKRPGGKQSWGTAHVQGLPDWLDLF